MKQGVMICLLMLFFCVLYSVSYADDAQVLPKGVFSIQTEYRHFLPVTERYNENGDIESLAHDFNADLNSNIFPALGQVEAFFGMPPGSATLGRSVVSFKYIYSEFNNTFMYGITDRLTVGVFIPYWWQKNEVKAKLNASTATVGKNAALDAIVPLSVPGTVPLTTDDVQNLLGRGLDINGDGVIDIPGFKYKRVKTWSDSGLSDIEGGLKYQYLKTKNWRLAFIGGVRFPTGQVDDPNNLVDLSFGDGAWAFLFRSNNDYTGIKNLVLNATFRYTLELVDRRTLRIPISQDKPITDFEEQVRRNFGDVTEVETSAQYEFFKGATLSALYKFGFKQKDRVKGSEGSIKSLEDETNWTEHIYIIGLYYSTLPLFTEKKFPVPLTASVQYRNRFAGTNNAVRSQYIAFGLQVFF
jgi:hypothetical protein